VTHLIGQTKFDLDTLAGSFYDRTRLSVKAPIDLLPVELSDAEQLLGSLIQMDEPTEQNMVQLLRVVRNALRFLTYQFAIEYDPDLDGPLQSGCLEWTPIPGSPPAILVQGKLNHWIESIFSATSTSRSPAVVRTFCQIYLVLENVGLSNVLSRFYKDPVILDGNQYFRLRYQ